jgi:hypothetical protein
MRLKLVSITKPQMPDPDAIGCGGVVAGACDPADGLVDVDPVSESPQPASPWTTTSRTTHPEALMIGFPPAREAGTGLETLDESLPCEMRGRVTP